jgi:hypothetical protein
LICLIACTSIEIPKNTTNYKYRTSIVAASHGKHANPQRQRVEVGKNPVQEPNSGYTGVHQARQAIKELERNDKTGKKNWTIMDRTIRTGVRRYYVIELPESKIPRPGTMVTEETASTQTPFASSDVSAALTDATLTKETSYGREADAEGSDDESASPPTLDSNAFEKAMSHLEHHGINYDVPDSSHGL